MPSAAPTPAGPGLEVVASGSEQQLSVADARRAMDALSEKLGDDSDLRLDLVWKLYRETSEK